MNEITSFTPEAVRAYVEVRAAQEAAKGRKVSVVCGAIIEEGDPTNGLNLRVREEIVCAMAQGIKAKREGC